MMRKFPKKKGPSSAQLWKTKQHRWFRKGGIHRTGQGTVISCFIDDRYYTHWLIAAAGYLSRWVKERGIRMIQKIPVLIIMVLVLCVVPAVAGSSEQENAALISAEKWLGMVDSGKYEESWKEAAELFRNAIKQEQWKQSLQGARKPLGKLVKRTIRTKIYKTSLPGAPDGEYVIIEFETSFEHKKSATETVTPMMDKDGKWRVSGYYIK